MSSSATSTTPSPAASPPRNTLLRDRNVAWLMGGSLVSLLGDQFTLVALPWLVLRMTGDTLVLGTVLALLGIPRALFILLGGALVDRHSPQRVLMLSKHVNTVLLGTLALLVLFALGIGLSTAFSIPAATSMLPQVVAPQQLPAANSLLMGLRQLSFFVGPLLAGLVIALFGDGRAGGVGSLHEAHGLDLAFGLDALSFVFSALTLAQVRCTPPPARAHAPMLAAVAEGLRAFWRDRALRCCLL